MSAGSPRARGRDRRWAAGRRQTIWSVLWPYAAAAVLITLISHHRRRRLRRLRRLRRSRRGGTPAPTRSLPRRRFSREDLALFLSALSTLAALLAAAVAIATLLRG